MTLEIAFLDVGSADSVIVLPPSQTAVVIDAPRPRRVVEWLHEHSVRVVGCLFFTHGHRDHLPSLSKVVTFIAEWLEGGSLELLCLPTEAVRRKGVPRQTRGSTDRQQYDRLRHALDRIDLWEEKKAFRVIRGERGPAPALASDIVVDILHPAFLFSEAHAVSHPNRINETSLVLRVDYGRFRALLLSDVEERGLKRLLAVCSDNELNCHIIKIPHHGAWVDGNADFGTLLGRVDPEAAILSVGSRNQHGHVAPRLFQELLTMKEDESKRLREFLCTEVTRTCVFSSEHRKNMGKEGLSESQQCAGDVTILADLGGGWEIKNPEQHHAKVESLPRPACRGKADLSIAELNRVAEFKR